MAARGEKIMRESIGNNYVYCYGNRFGIDAKEAGRSSSIRKLAYKLVEVEHILFVCSVFEFPASERNFRTG